MGIETYTVKANDTLSGIARRYYGRASLWPQIFAYNAIRRHGRPAVLKDPNKLRVGQRIWLPPRVSQHPPHLQNHLVYRHPAQVTRPAVGTATRPAAPAHVLRGATVSRPPSLQTASRDAARTHLNSFAFKYNLDLLPPIRSETPEFEFEAKYTGQIYIWEDKQIDILTLTNSGAELAAKHHTDTALGQLVNSGKVTWDARTNKVTYENLMTTNAVGAPPNLVAVGFVVDSTNPVPAIRAKFTSPKLAGRLPPTFLYLAETLTITLDIRPKPNRPQGPSASPQLGFAAIPHPETTLAAGARSQSGTTGGLTATAAGSSKPWWDRPSILLPGAAILVMAALASNVVTWGADTEVDPAAFSAAGAMAARALAH